ncbi:hypothetical protein QQF64_025388 [Cirrhinus molitorella]|uniref:Uncharacterized protein n=1 Tax=Cirrhinus molitorella TaxID=172907 RepID=A0ABR3NNW1_9TELE
MGLANVLIAGKQTSPLWLLKTPTNSVKWDEAGLFCHTSDPLMESALPPPSVSSSTRPEPLLLKNVPQTRTSGLDTVAPRLTAGTWGGITRRGSDGEKEAMSFLKYSGVQKQHINHNQTITNA